MKRTLSYLRPYRGWLLLSIVGTAFAALAELVLPSLLANIINAGTGQGVTGYIVQTGLIMILVSVLSVLMASAGNYFSARASAYFSKDLRSDVFRRVQDFTQADMNHFGPASLITRNTNDVLQIQNFILMFIRIIVRSPVMMVGGVIMAYTKNPGLARPVAISLPVILVFIMLISRFAMPYFKIFQQKLDRVNLVLREQIHGIRVIRAFGNEDHEEKRFDEANADMRNTGLKMMRTLTVMMPGLMVIMNITTIAIVWLGGLAAQSGGILAGDMIAVIQYVMQIMFSLVMMSIVFVMYPRAAASAQRIAEVLGAKPAITDKEKTLSPTRNTASSLRFEDVTFSFPNAEKPALERISFEAERGQMIAVIGSTGSGKSSILNLIVRFYDVTSGRILVDGIDVRDYAQADLRSRIGYIPQQNQLFSGSIAHNLRYGKPDAAADELLESAKTAQALDFIEQKEDGFESHVAQGGGNLSGGQKQRLAIARAIVRAPEIYLFDDSFSALDFATDAKLRASLKEKTKEAIVLIVAQRVSTIMGADRILVLDNGRIVGDGAHKELLVGCDVYREIVSSQFSSEEVVG